MVFKLHILRIVIFSLSSLFAIIVLGLAVQAIWFTGDVAVFQSANLAIAIAVITIMTLPTLMIIDYLRTGAFTSMIVVELILLVVLWVHWLAAAIDITQLTCEFIDEPCDGTLIAAVQGFSYLIWILLLSYSIVIFTIATIGANRGHKTWMSSVKYANFGPKDHPDVEQPAVQPHQPASPKAAILEYPMLPELHEDQSSPDKNVQEFHHTAPVGIQPAVELHQPTSPMLEHSMLPEPHEGQSSPDQNARGSPHMALVDAQPALQQHQPASPMAATLEYSMLPEPHEGQSSPDQNARVSHHAVSYM